MNKKRKDRSEGPFLSKTKALGIMSLQDRRYCSKSI